MDAQQEMAVLQGNPISISMFGSVIEVKKLTIADQQKAIKLIQDISENRENKSGMEVSFELMTGVVQIATGISPEKIAENGDMVEVAEAFKKIWKQNRFDFLLKTIAELGSDLTGEKGTK